MKELIAFRKYLNEGVLNEEKSIEDEIKRASKIILTNLISKNPDGWEDDHEEYVGVTDRDEFDDIGHNGRVVVSLMLGWAKDHYDNGIYKEVDELLNNYNWDSKFKRYKVNEKNKIEGVIKDDGDDIEPEFYVPILPTVLINGCTAGIGTGWSCSIPCYNPLDIIECVKIWMKNKTAFEEEDDNLYSLLPEILPYYKGFTGEIKKVNEQKYVTYGKCIREKTKGKRYKVTVVELPIQMWTDKFKTQLEDLLEKKLIKGLKNYSTPNKVKFEILENDELLCNEDTLKMHSYLYCSNMVLFDEHGRIKKYDTIDEIIDQFCQVRYRYYILRKKHQLSSLQKLCKTLQNKSRFLQQVMDEELVVYRKDYDKIVSEMELLKYDKDNKNTYDYLLNMNIRSFTHQRLEDLRKEMEKIEGNIILLKKTSETKLWLKDINKFEKEYVKWNKKN